MALRLRTKFWIMLMAWPIFAMPLIVLSVEVSNWFVIAFLALFVGIGAFSFTLSCPSCGKPIWMYRFAGFWFSAPYPERNCGLCGHDLDKPLTGPSSARKWSMWGSPPPRPLDEHPHGRSTE